MPVRESADEIGGPKALLSRLALLASPLVVLLVAYLVADPFKVLRRHDDYYPSGSRVILNRDFVSTELFLRNYSSQHYDAVVLGNSRSLAFLAHDWVQALGREAKVFHFDASGESLFGVERKTRLLDDLHVTPRDVLIVLDPSLLAGTTDSNGHIFMKHPLLSRRSTYSFQTTFIKAFFVPEFLVAYFDNALSGAYRSYMSGYLDNRIFTHIMPSNDLEFTSAEVETNRDGIDAYVARRKAQFGDRHARIAAPVIGPLQRRLLGSMATRFAKWRSVAEIIVSPLYSQESLNPADLKELQSAFGADQVHDFSGVNDITADPRHYYESSHYRPPIARRILAEVYPVHPHAEAPRL